MELKDFKLGLKRAWQIPLLPPRILDFYNHPFIRIFRVIGGFSTMSFFLRDKPYFKEIFEYHIYLKYIILFIALSHMILIVFITGYKVFHGFKTLKRNGPEFEIRNSPLNQSAQLAARLLYCWKFGCSVAANGVGLVGTSVLIDGILEAGGQEKVFTPLMGKGIKFIIGGQPADSMFNDLQKRLSVLKEVKARVEEAKKFEQATAESLKGLGLDTATANEIQKEVTELLAIESKDFEKAAIDLKDQIKKYKNR